MPFCSRLYGLKVHSCWPLPSAAEAALVFSELHVVESEPAVLAQRRRHARLQPEPPGWFTCSAGADGTVYLSWPGMLDALIGADGACIEVASTAQDGRAALANYLFAQLLSFPLIRAGLEPLHATTVLTPFGAVGLLGDSGAGKSTLAAGLLAAGCQLVADDLLALRLQGGSFHVLSGPPSLKLLPHAAARVLPVDLPSRPMNRFTRKRVYDLPARMHVSQPVELRALFVVERPHQRLPAVLTTAPLEGANVLRRLLRHTFNPLMAAPARLQHQLELYGRIAAAVPIRQLRIRRDLALLPVAVRALLSEVARMQQPLADQSQRAYHVVEREESVR